MSTEPNRHLGMQSPDFDANFDAVYDASSKRTTAKVLRELGLATGAMASMTTPEYRLARATSQASGVCRSLEEVQQFLVDDDAKVRRAARDGVHRVILQAFTGDQHERAWTEAESNNIVDRAMRSMLRVNDLDRAEPWWSQRRTQIVLRRIAIVASLIASATVAVLLALGHCAFAVPPLCVAAFVNIVEGAFVRTVHLRDAALRWVSCIASHGGELLMIGGVALAAARAHHALWGGAVVGAMLLTLFGSFVRVSAVQAGYRAWRSHSERYARYAAVLVYLVGTSLGDSGIGILALIVVSAAFGLFEVGRVVVGALRMPAVQGGGMVFVDRDDAVQAWLLDDEESQGQWNDKQVTRRLVPTTAGSRPS